MSSIHLYGFNHSPWCQAVLLTLHMKGLAYSMTSLLHPKTVLESYRQGVPVPIWMPALWYNGKCYYESTNLIELLDLKHQQKCNLFKSMSEKDVAFKRQKYFESVFFVITRVAGLKNLQFWYEWSIGQDRTSSPSSKFLSRFFRPFTTLYFWLILNALRIFVLKCTWPEKRFRKAIAYFSDMMQKNEGKYLLGSDITYIDILLLGHFQCMFSGSNGCGALSKEVIPIIDEHPILWQWLKNMHQHQSLIDYPYMYSRCDQSVLERTGEKKIAVVERENLLGQITFWIGAIFLVVVWPFTLALLLWMLGTRLWKKGVKSDFSPFKFKFKKLE